MSDVIRTAAATTAIVGDRVYHAKRILNASLDRPMAKDLFGVFKEPKRQQAVLEEAAKLLQDAARLIAESDWPTIEDL